jgi:hypothetical protein
MNASKGDRNLESLDNTLFRFRNLGFFLNLGNPGKRYLKYLENAEKPGVH